MAINPDKDIEVRDLRNGSWFWIQTHVWRDKRLKGSDRVTYATIASYANQDQEMFPSITKISIDGGLSDRQVYTCIKRLEKYGYLQIERHLGEHNVYKLLKTYPAPESELKEHTPATISPLKPVHTTPEKSTVGTPEKNGVLTISNITRSNNKTLLRNGETQFGNPDVNSILEYLKEKLELPGLDGSEKVNRQYAWLLIRKSKTGLDGVKWLIDQAADDGWWHNHITSVRDLWNSKIKIVSSKRSEVKVYGMEN